MSGECVMPIKNIIKTVKIMDEITTITENKTTILFTIPWSKVPLSLPAPKRECGIFGPGIMKNRIRNMGIKRATSKHMFATLAFGSDGNLQVLWTGQLFTSLV